MLRPCRRRTRTAVCWVLGKLSGRAGRARGGQGRERRRALFSYGCDMLDGPGRLRKVRNRGESHRPAWRCCGSRRARAKRRARPPRRRRAAAQTAIPVRPLDDPPSSSQRASDKSASRGSQPEHHSPSPRPARSLARSASLACLPPTARPSDRTASSALCPARPPVFARHPTSPAPASSRSKGASLPSLASAGRPGREGGRRAGRVGREALVRPAPPNRLQLRGAPSDGRAGQGGTTAGACQDRRLEAGRGRATAPSPLSQAASLEPSTWGGGALGAAGSDNDRATCLLACRAGLS